jgi:hypothetical protein
MSGEPSVSVYQFKIVLRRVSPMVWRRLLLRSDHSIADLHYAIQISMGWSDSHLHLFHIHGKDYGVAHAGGIFLSNDPKQIRLADFEFRLRERFLYEYDFYDHWEHDVRLEKVLPWNSRRILPACSGGHRLAPPEDCGGAQSYMEQGDPRWQEWWDAFPREELNLVAKAVKRVLDTGQRPIAEERCRLQRAVGRVKAHRAQRPDRIDRRAINRRLKQYASGDRAWLFHDTIGK